MDQKRIKKCLRKSGTFDSEICEWICSDICKNRWKGKVMASRWEKEVFRYPIVDHSVVWKWRGKRTKGLYFLVSHAYWNERSEEQLKTIQEGLEGSTWTLVSRDAVWNGLKDTPFKQIFIFGEQVVKDDVLSMPYDYFDTRCQKV